MNFVKLVMGLGVIGALSACSSVVPVSYYQVNVDAKVEASNVASQTQHLYIELVQVAPYLNSNSLILQTSSVQLHKSNQHQWAEALDLQLQRALGQQLQQLLPDWQVKTMQPAPNDCRLLVQIDKFHGQQDGQVLLAGRYHLLCGEQAYSQQFAAEQAQPEEGYPAMVATLSTLWQAEVIKIAEAIKQQRAVSKAVASSNS